MERRKALAVLAIGGTVVPWLTTEPLTADRREDCIHTAVLKVNANEVECVVCNARLSGRAAAVLTLSFDGWKDTDLSGP
jgi:hypothetical protein